MHQLWTEPRVRRFLLDDKVISRETAEQFIKSSLDTFADCGVGYWVLMLGDSTRIIGFCGFRFSTENSYPELLYGLSEGYWGSGLATEAVRATIAYGFETCGFERIIATTDTPNTSSMRVMERAGLTFEKRTVEDDYDRVMYGTTRNQWRVQTQRGLLPIQEAGSAGSEE